MEPEDLPWPGELEEEEEEEEEREEEAEDEVVVVEEVEGDPEPEFNDDFQPRDSTDEEDEEARAWLQAPPTRVSPPWSRYPAGERACAEKVIPFTCHIWQQSQHRGDDRVPAISVTTVSLQTTQGLSGDDQKAESWHCLPQEADFSQTLDPSQTRFSVTEEGASVTDLPSLEEGVLTHTESQVKRPDRDSLCSPLLVIQDNFASPDLPLFTCLTQDREFGSDSLFLQSELEFAPLRGVPVPSEDSEWFSRPSEVSEALSQATCEVASVNSSFGVSQPLRGPAAGCQRALPSPSRERSTAPKPPRDAASCDVLCSYMSLKTQEVGQQPESRLAGDDQVSLSCSSDTSDGNVTPKGSGSLDAPCAYMQCWKQEAFHPSETCTGLDSHSDSSDTVSEKGVPEGRDAFDVPATSGKLWWKRGPSQRPEAGAASMERVSFPHEVASHFSNKMLNSFLHSLLERRGEEVPLVSESHYFESAYVRIVAENEAKENMDSVEGHGKPDVGLGEQVPQHAEQRETRSKLVSSGTHPRSSETRPAGHVAVPDGPVSLSKARGLSRGTEPTKLPHPVHLKPTLGKTPEQLYAQDTRSQKETSAFGGENVDPLGNVAFEAVIASIEPLEKAHTPSKAQADPGPSLMRTSHDRAHTPAGLSLSHFTHEKSLLGQLSHPRYQSTPGVFEPAASKPLLQNRDVDGSSLYVSVPWEPRSATPFMETASRRQSRGLDKTQPAVSQDDRDNESIGKIKSLPTYDLSLLKTPASDSLVLRDLKQQNSEEGATSSDDISESLQGSTDSDSVLGDAAQHRVLDRPVAVDSERAAQLLREVDRSSLDFSEAFSSALPSSLPPKSRELDYYPSDLRMLSLSPETMSKTLRQLAGAPTHGGAPEIIQTSFKSGVSTAARDSEKSSDSPLDTEGLSQFTLRGTQQRTGGQHTDIFHQQTLPESRLSQQGLKVAALPALASQRTGLPTVSYSSHSSREKPGAPYQQAMPDSDGTGEALRALRAEQARVTSGAFSQRAEPSVVCEEVLPDSALTLPGAAAQRTEVQTAPSSFSSPREQPRTLLHPELSASSFTEEPPLSSPAPGLTDPKTGTSAALSSYYSQRKEPNTLYQQPWPDSAQTEQTQEEPSPAPGALPAHRVGLPAVPSGHYAPREKPAAGSQPALLGRRQAEEALRSTPLPGTPLAQKMGEPAVPASLFSQREGPDTVDQQTLPEGYFTKDTLKSPTLPAAIPAVAPRFSSPRETPSAFYQQVSPDSPLTEQTWRSSYIPGLPPDQQPGVPAVPSSSSAYGEKPGVFYQHTLAGGPLYEQVLKGLAARLQPDQKTGMPSISSLPSSHREEHDTFYQQELPDDHVSEESLRSSPAPGVPASQKTGMVTAPSSSHPQREMPGIYQQTLPEGHITGQAGSQFPVSSTQTAQKPEALAVSSSSSPQTEEPAGVFYYQTLPGSPLSEEARRSSPVLGTPAIHKTGNPSASSSSYLQREKTDIFYQQMLPDSNLSDRAVRAAVPGTPVDEIDRIPNVSSSPSSPGEKQGVVHHQELPDSPLNVVTVRGGADQKAAAVPPSSYPQREETGGVFYRQTLPDGSLSEEAVRRSPVPSVPPDQKTGTPAVSSSSYLQREKPSGVSYQQTLPDSSLSEEIVRRSPVPGKPVEQKTGPPTEKTSGVSYQQTFPDSSLSEEAVSRSPVPDIPADQKTEISMVSSTSYLQREKSSGGFHRQTMPDSHPSEDAVRRSPIPDLPAVQRTALSAVSSTSYPQREKPSGVSYQQMLPDSPLSEEAIRRSPVPGLPPDQKTEIPTVPSSSHLQREKSGGGFYQETLPDSSLSEEAVGRSPVSHMPPDQKAGTPAGSSGSYPYKEKPAGFYHQELPDSPLSELALRSQPVPGIPAGQATEIPTVSSTPYLHTEKHGAFYEQMLPDSYLSEEAQRNLPDPGILVVQKTWKPTVSSSSYLEKEKPSGVDYQQTLPDSHLSKEVVRRSPIPGIPADQKTGTSTPSSGSHPQREKPSTFYQQVLAESHLTEQAVRRPPVPGSPVDQMTEIPAVSFTSYLQEEKPDGFYQQMLSGRPLTEEAVGRSPVPGISADQESGTAAVSSSLYPGNEKTGGIFNQQTLPVSLLSEETVRRSPVAGIPADQETGTPTVSSSSYLQREKPKGVFYQQMLPDSSQSEEAVRRSPVSHMPPDQKTRTPMVLPSSYPQREKPGVFYQQQLPDSQPGEEAAAVRRSPVLDLPPGQKTGTPSVSSSSYLQREKPGGVFYQQMMPDGHLTEQTLGRSPVEDTPTVPASSSYSVREKPGIFSQQPFSLTEEALKGQSVPGRPEQKSEILAQVSSSHSHREKPETLYQQVLPDSHLTEEAPKGLLVPEPADRKAGIPAVPSSLYSEGEETDSLYQQEWLENFLIKEFMKRSSIPLPGSGWKVSSTSYLQREKPGTVYQQELPDTHLTAEGVNSWAVLGADAQKTEVLPSSSLYKEKPSPLQQQRLPDHLFTDESLKVLTVPGPTDQKTGTPPVPSKSNSREETPHTLYQQTLPDRPLTEETLKDSSVPGPTDQKTGKPTVPSIPYSHKGTPGIFYQQESPNNDLVKETPEILSVSRPTDQKSGLPTVPCSVYSQSQAPDVHYEDVSSDARLTEESVKSSRVSAPADQETRIAVLSDSLPPREKPSALYQQNFAESHLTEEPPRVSTVPGAANKETRLLIAPDASHEHRVTLKVSPVPGPDEQKTESPAAPDSHAVEPRISAGVGSDDQKRSLLTVVSGSYFQKEQPSVFSREEVPDRHLNEGNLKISTLPEPAEGNTGKPIPLGSSYSQTEKSHAFHSSELSDKQLTERVPKTSIPGPAGQKIVLPPSPVAHREKFDGYSPERFPGRPVTEDAWKASGGLGQSEQVIVLPTGPSSTYSHGEKYKLVSEHAQRLIDHFESYDPRVHSKIMPVNSQAEGRVSVQKLETLGVGDLGPAESRTIDSGSKTLKEIQTLLMEAENLALKRCGAPVPLVPFRDTSGVSSVHSKKVCFKEPATTDECDARLAQKQPLERDASSSRCAQKESSTQTGVRWQSCAEGWELLGPAGRASLQEAGAALRESLGQCGASGSVVRSEPEGCSGILGSKIVIPVMTFIRSDSSSDDTSDGRGSCSCASHPPDSAESMSDVVLNFFPEVSPHASVGDREEECVSESEDGGSSSVDSLANHVRNLLQCESSLNHAKQILRDAEEEECRVRARAWNLKFNLARECGYSISELNEDDRRKVEEIKAKLFGQERAADLSPGSQSTRGIGCQPKAVCSHIIIESHEKGCLRTLSAQQKQLESPPCMFRSDETQELIPGQPGSSSSWRARHISLSRSLDHSHPRFRVWNSLHFQSHSPCQNLSSQFKMSKDLAMPLRGVGEPVCMSPEEMDVHAPQRLSSEPMNKFTASITFSAHQRSSYGSDPSILKVGVKEGGPAASLGVYNSHFAEEQSPLRGQNQKISSPLAFNTCCHSPGKDVAVLADCRHSQMLPIGYEHSHQEGKLLEKANGKMSHCEPRPSADSTCTARLSPARGVQEKSGAGPPDLPSLILLEQRELFEQSKAPRADYQVRRYHSPPPHYQDGLVPDLPSRIFLEQRELLQQSKASPVDCQMRDYHPPIPQGQDCVTSDLPSDLFLEQRKLFEQGQDPHVGHHDSASPQDQECVVKEQRKPKPHSSDVFHTDGPFSDTVSESVPRLSSPPLNRKAVSCVHITLSPKASGKADGGALDKRVQPLDPVCKSKTREPNSDLQTTSSRQLDSISEPTSLPDNQAIIHSPPRDDQHLKYTPPQHSLLMTSRQTQVSMSDLQGYFNPKGTPVSPDRPPEESQTTVPKVSSDAVTQITTESPEKALFSSEIFINAEVHGRKIPVSCSPWLLKSPVVVSPSSQVQSSTSCRDTQAERSVLPYKPPGSGKMYYVPELGKTPPADTKSDTTLESSHSGSNDAIAPVFPAQVLGTRDDNLSDTVGIRHREGIYSKRAVTKPSWAKEGKPTQDTAGPSHAMVPSLPAPVVEKKDQGLSREGPVTNPSQSVEGKPTQKDTAVQVCIIGDESISDPRLKEEPCRKGTVSSPTLPEQMDSAGCSSETLADEKDFRQREELHSKGTVPRTAWAEEKESLHIDTAESICHPGLENTTHSVFRSAQFYFHHPVHQPADPDFGRESLGKGVFMRESAFPSHPHKDQELPCGSPPHQSLDKTKMDYTRVESLRINMNLGNKAVTQGANTQGQEHPKYSEGTAEQKRDHTVAPEPAAPGPETLNELWSRYQERQRKQRPPECGDKRELSLVERLDRLARLLQNPIAQSLQASEDAQDDSREGRRGKEWAHRQREQKNKLEKKKRCKDLERHPKSPGEPKSRKGPPPHPTVKPNQIKFEHIKFNKYILRKQPSFHYISNTSSESRASEESELLTDTTTNLLSTTSSPVDSECLTQTDREVALNDRSSSISTIDTARLIQAFGHERVCVSPRRIRLYSSVTSQHQQSLERRCKHSQKAARTGRLHVAAEHTRSKNIQMEEHVISSDSISSAPSSFWSSSPRPYSKQSVHMSNKGVQAGNLEIVSGTRRHTRDVGVTFPTPSSSEVRLEEDSDAGSCLSEDRSREERFLATYPLGKKLRKNKANFYEAVSWFVPVENMKRGPKKENVPGPYQPGISWFEPINNSSKPWREPLREKNWQAECRGGLGGPCKGGCVHPLKAFVRADLQEALHARRPDFIFRSGERLKRLKLIVQERKLQKVLQSERDMLFNSGMDWQGCGDHTRSQPRRDTLAAQKNRLIGKKEMIQRSRRMYEQLPEVRKRKEEEKRRLEYKSYRLRAQLYKKRVTNQLLGRKVPWD